MHGQKNIKLSRIEPATFWLVARCLNQPRHHVVSFLLAIRTNMHLSSQPCVPQAVPILRSFVRLPQIFFNVKLIEGDCKWATCGRRDKMVQRTHNMRHVSFYPDNRPVYRELAAINHHLFLLLKNIK